MTRFDRSPYLSATSATCCSTYCTPFALSCRLAPRHHDSIGAAHVSHTRLCLGRTGRRSGATPSGHTRVVCRFGARVLRLLHLRPRHRPDLRRAVLQAAGRRRRHDRIFRHLRGRLRGPSDRRHRLRPPRRQAGPQDHPDHLHRPDGRLVDADRPAADLPRGWHLGRHPAGDAAHLPGPGRGRRAGRRDRADLGVRSRQAPRLLRLAPVRRHPDRHPAGRRHLRPARSGPPRHAARLAVARPLPARLRADHRRPRHPDEAQGVAGVRGARRGRGTPRGTREAERWPGDGDLEEEHPDRHRPADGRKRQLFDLLGAAARVCCDHASLCPAEADRHLGCRRRGRGLLFHRRAVRRAV